jgi:hypothetical protein
MTAKEQLMQEIEYIPEPLIQEVLNFLLLTKNTQLLEPKTEYHHLNDLNTNFWDSEPLSSQSIPVITDIRVLAASFWEDESVDEFDQFIASSRQADR